MRKTLKITVLIALIGVLIFSAVQAALVMWQYHRADDYYQGIRGAVSDGGPTPTPPLSEPTTDPPDPPPIKEEPPIQVDFEQLTGQYPDLIGWLYCEGTPINYPVMQGKDNNQYLRHLPDGSYSVAGSLFADYRCGKLGEDMNFVIYGHNMKNESMFGTLVRYKEQSYYDSHPVLWLLTPSASYIIKVAFGAVVQANSESYCINFSSGDKYAKYITQIKKNSTFISEVEDISSNMVTLSTCSYEYENARFILVGILEEA